MPLGQVPLSFAAGVGNLMGHIAIVLALGAVLGRLVASSGGASSLGKILVEGCHPQGLPWAMLGLSLIHISHHRPAPSRHPAARKGRRSSSNVYRSW